MNRALTRAVLPALALLLSTACDSGLDAPIGTARLPLTAEMVTAAEVLTLVAWQGETEIEVWRFPDLADPDARDPGEALFELEAGRYDRLELRGSIDDRRLYFGESAAFEVEAGEEIVVRILVDPFGRLEVRPLGLDLLDGVGVRVVPRDPLPGDPPSYGLELTGDHFAADLPVGTYGVRIDLPAGLGDLITLDPLEVEVITGGVIDLRPAFGPPEDPPLPPIVTEVLDLDLGGRVALLGAAVDVSLRALDGEGREVADYAGEVLFEAEITAGLGGLLGLEDLQITVPGVYRFDPEVDRGSRVFVGGLQVVSLVGGLLGIAVEVEVTVTDAALDLEASARVCFRNDGGDC